MARAKKQAAAQRRGKAQRPSGQDAIRLLENDHRQVKEWFAQFEKARSEARKETLASQICHALKVHTQIEEEIFYPAFLEATGEKDMHHQAEVEHNGAAKLITEIESSGPEDEYFDAKVTVLCEMIKHHVAEEEKKREGIFSKARASDMDLRELGARLAQRKAQLENGGAGYRSEVRTRARMERRPHVGS